MSAWFLDSELSTCFNHINVFLVCLILLYNKTSLICTETWSLVFIKAHYGCAMATLVTEVLHFCTTLKRLSGAVDKHSLEQHFCKSDMIMFVV